MGLSPGERGMSQGKKAWDPENGVVVFVEKNEDGFSFEISDEYGTTWQIYQHPKNKEYFVIERNEIESFWITEAKQFRYAEFEVKNLSELYQEFLQNPEKFIRKLTKLKKHVTEIRTDDKEIEINSHISGEDEEDNVNEEEWWDIYGPCYRGLDNKEWTLVVEKYDNGFRFYLENEPCKLSWLIEQYPLNPERLILTFEKNGKEVVSILRNCGYYSVDHEVGNIWDLYKMLVKDPSRYFYFITALDAPIGHVKIIDKSRHFSPVVESKA